MKTTKYATIKMIPFLFTGLLVLLFTSCGTHNSNEYGDRDGIYTSEKEIAEEDNSENDVNKDSYYKQYFKNVV